MSEIDFGISELSDDVENIFGLAKREELQNAIKDWKFTSGAHFYQLAQEGGSDRLILELAALSGKAFMYCMLREDLLVVEAIPLDKVSSVTFSKSSKAIVLNLHYSPSGREGHRFNISAGPEAHQLLSLALITQKMVMGIDSTEGA